MMLASIPSPSFNSIDIGPFSLNIYGLCIALGVVAAVWLFGRRLEERGVGTRDDASAIGVVAVLAGVIGARLYHVATDWDRFDGNLSAIPKVWEGGLGIPGGLLLGIPVGLWMSKRHGISYAVAATCAAPAIPLAQAIGRFGNYFNQELYGRSTDLPWALEIDEQHLLPGYTVGTTFHPTFLYESLWSLGLVFLLLWIDRRFRPPDGQLMVMYLIGYGIGRFWVEGLRIDRADVLGGLRLNQWVALAAVFAGLVALALWPSPTERPDGGPEPGNGDADGGDADGPDDDGEPDVEPDADEPDEDEPDEDIDEASDDDGTSGDEPDDDGADGEPGELDHEARGDEAPGDEADEVSDDASDDDEADAVDDDAPDAVDDDAIDDDAEPGSEGPPSR